MILRVLCTCSLLCGVTLAEKNEPAVKTELLTIALADAVDGLFYFDGESARSFEANLTGLSQPNPYQGPQQFVVRNKPGDFTADPLPAPAASVLLPTNCRRVLLACIKTGKSPLRIVAYDISTQDRAGDYRFFNFSNQTLSFILGDERFAIAPGKNSLASNSKWREAVLDIPVKVAAVENNNTKLVYSSIWGHRPGRRNFIFMLSGAHRSKPITFCRFFDIPSKDSQEP